MRFKFIDSNGDILEVQTVDLSNTELLRWNELLQNYTAPQNGIVEVEISITTQIYLYSLTTGKSRLV